MEKEQYISKLLEEYPYIEYTKAEEVYEIAKRELFITLYSCNSGLVNEDTKIPYIYEYKVLEAMKEIVDIGNLRNFTSYSENGWSWTRPSKGLSTYINIKSYVGGF